MILTTLGVQGSTAVAAAPVFRASSSANINRLNPSVNVPAAVQPGDQLVLVVTINRNTTIGTPAGWNLLGTAQDGRTGGTPDVTSAVFATTADATSAGSTVVTPLGLRSKTALTLVAYADAAAASVAIATTKGASSADMTTADIAVALSDTIVLSYWADKSSNTGWTAPAEVTTRATSIGSGGGRVTALIGDRVVDAGIALGATATSSTSGGKSIGWTIALDPTNEPPTAAFTPDCLNLDCSFDASASNEPNGTIASYDWDFGDGSFGTGVNPSHTFTAGSFFVELTVTDDDGETDTVTIEVTTNVPPNEAPTAAFTTDCTELSCAFDAAGSTDTDGIITAYDWDFGDTGTATGVTAAHVFAPGEHTVVLTVTDDGLATNSASSTFSVFVNEPPTAAFTPACLNLDCSFDAGASNEPNGTIASYDWDFGDGTIELDAGATPSHSYVTAGDFLVALTVTDDDGETGDVAILVTTNLPPNEVPTAAFTFDCTGVSCAFDGSGSFEPNGTIVRYDWDFGDGNTAPDGGATPTNLYALNGGYTVTLTVTDDDTETDSIAQLVTTNIGPTASFAVVCTDLGCTFDATASSDPDGSIAFYDWDFGDLAIGTGVGPSHTYAAAGTYDVMLTVTDDIGATDSITLQASPTWPNELPVALFTPSCTDLRCTMDAIASNEPNGTIARYDWDFGDGNSAPDGGFDAVHNYLFDGTYTIALTVTDDDGETATTSVIATADFPTPPSELLPPDTPRRNVPIINTGEITDIEYIGNRVYIVGSFSSIRNNAPGANNTVAQRWLAAYDINTGLVDTTFRPTFDRGVTEIARSPDGTKLFVVGRFNNVNGITRRKIASIDPVTGATVTAFSANANSAATSVAASNDTVYVGGQFSRVRNTPKVGLVAVNAVSGQLVANFDNNMSGGIGVNGLLTVQAMDLSEDLSTLLVVHTGRQIDGQDRYGIGLIDATTNQLLPWRTRLWDDNLARVGGIQRIYTGSIAPNGEYFVVGSSSGGDRPPISDTAVAYSIRDEGGGQLGDFVEPRWISRMFDSVQSIDITDDAIFVGGHMNYAESQTAPDPWPGLDNVGYGRGQGLSGYGLGDDVVVRGHIAAIDPIFGKALEWNPGSNSFEGNGAMLVTPRGLFAGGDANIQGGFNVGRVAFYDFASVAAPGQNETAILYPIEGRVEKADAEFVIGGTATATSGVNRVQLEVISNNRWLQDDLTTFGNWNAINVILENPGATSTNWAQPLVIEGNRELRLLARTFANNNSRDASKDIQRIETFGLDDATPATRITAPSFFSVIPTLDFTASGTATDDIGVVSIRISLRDAQNRYLQDDGSVDALYNTVTIPTDVIGAPAATWSYDATVPYESEWTMQAIAVDTSGQADLRSSSRSWIVSETAERPAVAMTTPVIVSPPFDQSIIVAPGSPITITGLATDDEGLREVEIRLRNSITDENLTRDGLWGIGLSRGFYRISPIDIAGTSYNWSYTTPFNLTQGVYDFDVYATDDLGLRTSGSLRVDLNVIVQIPGDTPPDTLVDVPGTVTDVEVLHLDLTGTATDDLGVSQVLVELRDLDTGLYLQLDGSVGGARVRIPTTVVPNPDPTSVTWNVSLDLPTEGEWNLEAFAIDTAGQIDTSQSGAQARYFIYPGDLPPLITLLSPPNGTVFNDARIFVSGRVDDDRQIAAARVAIQDSAGFYLGSSGTFTSTTLSWRNAFLNSPGSLGSNFSYTTPAIPSGNYTVFVIGVDSHGFETEIPGQIAVIVTSPPNDPPVANFTVSCAENVCSFDGRTSTDEDAPTLTYSWDFGNGFGSGPVPIRTYTSAADFSVTLTVTDFYGLTAVTTQIVTIAIPGGNLAPIPVAASPSCSLLTCNFSSLGTADPNLGDSVTLLWDFGDGLTSTSTFPSHAFALAGTYNVVLTATDGWGAFATTSLSVDIQVPLDNVAPTPVIETPVCTLLSCQFSSINSLDPNAGDTFTRSWDFGDAGTSTSTDPLYAYAAAGTYTVVLTVTDVWGASDNTSVEVTVSEI